MKYNPLLEPYKALVPFLAELLGESCEILLHDISQPKHSVIAIANGFQHWPQGRQSFYGPCHQDHGGKGLCEAGLFGKL